VENLADSGKNKPRVLFHFSLAIEVNRRYLL
jgi:hypothetical protein